MMDKNRNTNPTGDRDTETYRNESNPYLVDIIRAKIESDGPVTFHDYMELALYHPQHGYYQASAARPGREGDFLTAPEVDPIFGRLVARQVVNFWELMDKPAPFTVIEYGAGRGTLAASLLDELHEHEPELYAAIQYHPVEVSAERIDSFMQTLTDSGHHSVVDIAPQIQPVIGCVIANEYLDALPVHRVVMKDGTLQEIAVGWHQGWFNEQLIPLSDPGITSALSSTGVVLNEGDAVEYNPSISNWISQIDAQLERGFALIIDYGYPGDQLYSDHRRNGTVRGYYQHGVSTEYYRGVGQQDLTAHVNLTAISRAAEAAGWKHLGDTDQASFLGALGIAERLMELQSHPEMTIERYLGIRAAVMRLIDPGSMGRFAVQMLEKPARNGREVEPGTTLPRGLTPLPSLW